MAYILVVDDDTDFASAVETVLKSSGYEVAVENQTATAMESIRKRPPDLIVLDVMFPENSTEGFEFARKIKAEKAYKAMPILLLTAVNEKFPFGFNPADIDNEWLPISDFAEKPVDFAVLKAKVRTILKG